MTLMRKSEINVEFANLLRQQQKLWNEADFLDKEISNIKPSLRHEYFGDIESYYLFETRMLQFKKNKCHSELRMIDEKINQLIDLYVENYC